LPTTNRHSEGDLNEDLFSNTENPVKNSKAVYMHNYLVWQLRLQKESGCVESSEETEPRSPAFPPHVQQN